MPGIVIEGNVKIGGNIVVGATVLDLTKYLISQAGDNFVSESGTDTFIEE